ncbi:hypothetical protein BCON_0330g00110 [Botryotinia convoluta]|uniref:Uncharacterized protein n=1 Tax=Botryotinia convoluta TaxID=54673 RepID=A0A4Z1HB94_9HELO|nr:hypothetical protein BCON_0330g00110 [Botryotinia convoluta]
MSSANPTTHPEIFTTTSTNNDQDDFAQTKEDFDISSIPDSDSEGDDTIYYQIPKKEKGVDGFADQLTRDDEIVYDTSIADLTGDGGQDDDTIARPVILSRYSTPTTDELIKYINDTGLLGVDNNDGSTTKSPTTSHQESEELARIRKVITRNLIPRAHHTAENLSGAENLALTEVQNASTHLPPGTPLIRDFAFAPLLAISNPRNPHNPHNLSTPRAPRFKHHPDFQTSHIHTYSSPGIRTLRHFHGFLFPYAVNDIHAPSDDNEEEEELYRELSAGEEADDEEYMDMSGSAPAPPPAPVLGKRDTQDLAAIEELEGDEELFQMLPTHLEKSRQLKEKNLEDSRISASILHVTLTPRIHIHLPIPHLPQETLPTYQPPGIDAWPLIALAHHIPLFPTHILTSTSLAQLSFHEKHLRLQNGYSSSPLDQWALNQHRLFLWINSGALDDGIDGDIRRPESADVLLGFGEESSEVWDYEDVEVFARWEEECFRRCLQWVQDVEVDGEGDGEEEGWGGLGLEDEVYDFCGEEKFLHRSASVAGKHEKKNESSSSSECIEEEYDAEDGRGDIRSAFPSLLLQNKNETQTHDPRLGRVVNIFRQPINHTAFRETGIQAADYAHANAMARFERIAEDFARREGEAGKDSVGLDDQSGFVGAEVHMRGGAGSGDSGKGFDDKSSSTGSKSQNPLPPSASNPKPNTSHLHPHLQAQIDKIKIKIPPHLSLFHAIETLNQKLRVHSTTPRLLICAVTNLPGLLNNLLPALSPSALLTTSTTIHSAHTPIHQKILNKLVEIPAQIAALPLRALHGISEIQKRKEERVKRQEERAALLENDGSAEIDTELLRLEE